MFEVNIIFLSYIDLFFILMLFFLQKTVLFMKNFILENGFTIVFIIAVIYVLFLLFMFLKIQQKTKMVQHLCYFINCGITL